MAAADFPASICSARSERRLVHAGERRMVHPASGSHALTTVASCDGCCRCFAQAWGRRSAAAVNGCPGYKRTMLAMLEHALTDCATLLRGTAGELCARLHCPCAGCTMRRSHSGKPTSSKGPIPLAPGWIAIRLTVGRSSHADDDCGAEPRARRSGTGAATTPYLAPCTQPPSPESSSSVSGSASSSILRS